MGCIAIPTHEAFLLAPLGQSARVPKAGSFCPFLACEFLLLQRTLWSSLCIKTLKSMVVVPYVEQHLAVFLNPFSYNSSLR